MPSTQDFPKQIFLLNFYRLVTAYRDRLERYNRKYSEEYGEHMVRRYRAAAHDRFGEPRPDIFPVGYDFVGDPVPMPSFWEFVQHLVPNTAQHVHKKKIFLQAQVSEFFVSR